VDAREDMRARREPLSRAAIVAHARSSRRRPLSLSLARALECGVLRGAVRRPARLPREMSALRRVALAAVASASAAGTAYVAHEEGARRSVVFWYHAFPVYASYRLVQARHRDLARAGVPAWTGVTLSDEDANDAYERLHEAYATRVRDLVYEMRGFYLKNAQLLSTRDDFVPRQYLSWCKETQDSAPVEMKPGEAKDIAVRELAANGHTGVFEEWDERPLGVASIGQAHRAKLSKKYGGKTVVVKVQAPGIERRFRADIRTCIDFCKLAMPQHVPPLEEIERQFMTEFDYRAEAENLEEVRSTVMPAWGNKVYIPAPHKNLCTKEILVMDEVPGKRLVDGIRDQLEAIARYQGTTMSELEEKERQKIESGSLKSRDVKQASRQTNRANVLLFVQHKVLTPFKLLYNVSPLRLLTGPVSQKPPPKLINLGALLQTLIDVHAYEIFVTGVFNGDPHPGNIMLMPDGRLGLIDYGQVKRINLDTQRAYAKLILAVAEGDAAECHRIVQSDKPEGFGARSKNSDPQVSLKLSTFWNDRDTTDVTEGLNLQEFLDEMQARDPVIKAPDEMVMIARVSVLLRGMGNAFNIRLRMAEAWREDAEKLLERTDPDYFLLSRNRKRH